MVVEPPESLGPLTSDSLEEFTGMDMFFIKELFLISIPFIRDSREFDVEGDEEPGTEEVADLIEGLRSVL